MKKKMSDDSDAGGLNVLIVAEHASARFGGEAILPLHYFRVMRRRGIGARLIVHARTRQELLERFPDDWDAIFFVPDTRLHILLDRIGRWFPSGVSYFTSGWISRLSSQLAARRIARRLIREHRVALIHQPIPVSPKETSVLHGLGVPLLIGPMNGGMNYPPAFAQATRGQAVTRAMRHASRALHRLLPGKIRAEVLLVANERTRRALPAEARGRIVELVENGVDLSVWAPKSYPTEPRDRVRFIFCGRLVAWKAINLLIESFAGVRERIPAELYVLGDGPMRGRLQEQVDRLGLNNAVVFRGWQTQSDCAAMMRDADVFVLPSLYECGGAVVLEAMAVGLPVIATDWGGPSDYLDPSCGILVPPTSREALISGFREAMLRLASSPELRATMGRAGRARIEKCYDWERKVDRILEVYADACRGAKPRPEISPAAARAV